MSGAKPRSEATKGSRSDYPYLTHNKLLFDQNKHTEARFEILSLRSTLLSSGSTTKRSIYDLFSAQDDRFVFDKNYSSTTSRSPFPDKGRLFITSTPQYGYIISLWVAQNYIYFFTSQTNYKPSLVKGTTPLALRVEFALQTSRGTTKWWMSSSYQKLTCHPERTTDGFDTKRA